MTKMMIDMGIRPSSDVDADFAAMMVPHHRGAIEMAQAELRYGRNEPLRDLLQCMSPLQCVSPVMCIPLGPPPGKSALRRRLSVCGDGNPVVYNNVVATVRITF
jgi:hypothetical protein